jgi:MinD-like ATPase involved in chromosome partitioning or flagellar assembly
MTLRPHIFTFYSYKGGVGRSMALLNVAYTLHSLGRHVLVVDLDLEAPGVSGFLRRYEELEATDEHKPDVVDLLNDLMPAVQWEMGDASRPELPVLGKYLRSVKSDGTKYAPAKNPRFRRTRLDVLCASDDRNYAERLGALDIAKLSGDQLVIAGNLIREVFFGHDFPWGWLATEDEKPTHYDYILIDSRTGFTETSGLCIGPLADRLVLFCGLNDQNINGTAEFLKVVGLKPSTQGEAWDDDVPKEGDEALGLGQKPTLLIASPVPFGEMEMKKDRFAEMEKILGAAPDSRISYHPRLSIIETVFCRDGAEESIRQEYDDIAMRLLSMVGDHPDQWERRIQLSNTKYRLDIEAGRRAASLDEREGRRISRFLIFRANRLMEQAGQETGAEAEVLFRAVEEKYQAALAIKPDDDDVLYNLACLCALREEVTSCLVFLSDAEKYGEGLTKAKLDNDSDFDRVRTDPAFVAFRDALPAGEAT